ncbi:Gamma-tubulin complex component 3 [Tritrichomonas musculus]|uniref:Gamma-tubulin complex component 3 n=1 Tax=Tritrichomonas musculus TaxID=1915356 RepID=A0ABR2KQR9_9EUKA
MIHSQIKGLIDDLSSSILQTDDTNSIERARAFGYFLLEAPHKKNSPHDFKFWVSRWKKSINPNKIDDIESLKYLLPTEKLPIYSLLDALKRTKFNKEDQIKKEESPFQTVIPFAPTLSEEQLIPEILKLLKGEESNSIKINGLSLETEKDIASQDAILIKKIFRIILCLNTIRESENLFIGKIGESMKTILDLEYSNFIEKISSIDELKSTFISILSVLSSQLNSKIYAATIICEVLKAAPTPSIINTVLYTQNYGLQSVNILGSKMVDAGISALLVFIRNWTVFGVLDDEYLEFFIAKNKGKIESGKWWQEKYFLVNSLLPDFLKDNNVVKKILSSGRAHNFLRKYSNSCSNYVSNFGSTAPFAVNFDQPKQKRANPDMVWTGPPFELSMVDHYARDSMESLMTMMMKVVWISGHLKVVKDFLLFGRGDFADVLYKNFNETIDGDAPSLLLHAIQSITESKNYTNPITNEVLTDRIDMAKKWSIQPTPQEALIIYLVNPPIDSFLGQSVLRQYDLVGHLIWKLKCCECQLGSDWHNARQLQMMEIVGFKSRIFCLLRHLMLYTIRTILDYILTDVILVCWKELDDKMKNVTDYDDLFEIHTNYMNKLLKGSFQTNEFEAINKSLNLMCQTINEFTDIEQEFEGIYFSFLNNLKKNKEMRKENPLFLKTKKETHEINKSINRLYGQFNKQIADFYLLSYDNMESLEMHQLEVRLRSCVANIQ